MAKVIHRKNVQIRLPISKQIDVSYRGYALYVLENRGIPSFYDALTNVQRIILSNAPASFDKTLSVIGSCFKAGYHHGDASVQKAINRITKPYVNSLNLLEGDGFFGNPINADAAAGRYTKVRIKKESKDLIFKNSFLNTKDSEGFWNPFWTELPVGLATQITGIAVGYKTTILPRKLSDIQQFIAGNRKTIKPYYQNFTGKITKVKGTDKTWLVEGVANVNEFEKSIGITEIPPMMKYGSFLKKLSSIVERHGASVAIFNDSTTSIKLRIKYKGRGASEWNAFKNAVVKATKMIVTETPVFIKDGSVIEYAKIEDYLIDFRYRIAELNVRKAEYKLAQNNLDLDFNIAKLAYLKFMMAKKRTVKDIDEYLSQFASAISSRLNAILLRYLSEDEIKTVTELIKSIKGLIRDSKKEVSILTKIFNKMEDTANIRKIASSTKSTDLFDGELTEIDGIEVFTGDDKYDDEEDEEDNE